MTHARRAFFAALFFFAAAANAAPYRLDLQLTPMAPFPFLSKFGAIDLNVYPGGVHGQTMILKGYSRNGSPHFTVMNPYGRMYTEIAVSEISSIILKLSGSSGAVLPQFRDMTPVSVAVGKVRGVTASRYRFSLGKDAWLDVWTTNAVPRNPQFVAIQNEFLTALSPALARSAARLPGMPVYVELKTRRFNKVPLLRMTGLSASNAGEADALQTGSFYFKAPLLDLLFK